MMKSRLLSQKMETKAIYFPLVLETVGIIAWRQLHHQQRKDQQEGEPCYLAL